MVTDNCEPLVASGNQRGHVCVSASLPSEGVFVRGLTVHGLFLFMDW